jgi:hypothetical protein
MGIYFNSEILGLRIMGLTEYSFTFVIEENKRTGMFGTYG